MIFLFQRDFKHLGLKNAELPLARLMFFSEKLSRENLKLRGFSRVERKGQRSKTVQKNFEKLIFLKIINFVPSEFGENRE